MCHKTNIHNISCDSVITTMTCHDNMLFLAMSSWHHVINVQNIISFLSVFSYTGHLRSCQKVARWQHVHMSSCNSDIQKVVWQKSQLSHNTTWYYDFFLPFLGVFSIFLTKCLSNILASFALIVRNIGIALTLLVLVVGNIGILLTSFVPVMHDINFGSSRWDDI